MYVIYGILGNLKRFLIMQLEIAESVVHVHNYVGLPNSHSISSTRVYQGVYLYMHIYMYMYTIGIYMNIYTCCTCTDI